jgi:predicted NAD/FAD-dependent oxidoreductase
MANASGNPSVTIAGGGVAGLTAAHRLLQRGYDVTLIEANAFLGGKLGAHQPSAEQTNAGSQSAEPTCPACEKQGRCLRDGDWHEHCYHMYLNWYHNFWELMQDIGALDSFFPMPAVYNIHRTRRGSAHEPAIPVVNVGSPWTTLRNLFCRLGTPADMFLWGQTMADLVGQPAHRDGWLERTSITAFMRSRPYTTDQALAGTYRTTAQAFASPSYLSSARSYKALLSYGLRLPEPSMWLLNDSTEAAIFTPWLARLAQFADTVEVEEHEYFKPTGVFQRVAEKGVSSPRLTLKMLTSLQSLEIDGETGRITHVKLEKLKTSPTVLRGKYPFTGLIECLEIKGDLILALPLSQLDKLVTPAITKHAPKLANVRYLRREPMISIDLFFRKKLNNLPNGITVLLDSPLEMSFFDNSQSWKELANGNTVLNVVASNADTITPDTYSDADIINIILRELHHYVDFDPQDLFDCRTHLQTNVGEELFVNQVGSWEWRPTATCPILNLYIAGDYCKTFIDVVTIEGAVVSGLMAAEALRRHRDHGPPIRILEPDQYPVLALSAAAAAQRPLAYLAWAFSAADEAIKGTYRQWFPNG